MDKAEEVTEALLRKISGIPEKRSKTVLLGEALAKMEDDLVLEVFRIILKKSEARIPRYQEGLSYITDIPEMVRRLGNAKLSTVYTLSRERGYEEVTRLLRRIPPHRRSEDSPDEVYQDVGLKDVALGMRKTLAKSTNMDLVNRLLHDQDHSVIQHILMNPFLTEDQVIRIASKRPTSAEILKAISKNNKWLSRYRIKRVLILNPYTPTDVSIRLLRFMMTQDLVEISQDGSLHEELRSATKDILHRKVD